jgi:DNA-binding NtrC family response regulator
VVPVGGNKPVKFDCRIMVASHKILKDEIKLGNFREDLYYRLFGLQVELPPLRDRDKDILLLSKYFVKTYCKENNIALPELSREAQEKLMGYNFPGNVRELKAVIELAIVMSDGNEIKAGDIKFAEGDLLHDITSRHMTMREYQYSIIHFYLKKFDNDIKKVADKLDIGQSSIYRFMKDEKFKQLE